MGLLSDNAITELVQWAINKFSLAKHSHDTSEVTGLAEALDGKAAATHNHTKSQITDFPTIPTKTSQLENDSNFITEGSGTQITVDSALSETSVNPVQNKVVKAALDGKSDSTHTHKYAGASSAGGSATSAVKLDTATAGSTTQPCYFTGGKPAACTYTLGKSVPSNAVFTDTTYGVVSTTANGLCPKRGGTTTKFLRDDGTWAVPPDTKYTHPTTAGNKHIPAGGSSGQILKWSAAGTAAWGNTDGISVICGQYGGAGGSGKNVNIGVTPLAVIVTPRITTSCSTWIATTDGDVVSGSYTILKIVENGFTTGYGSLNATGATYNYMAFVAS